MTHKQRTVIAAHHVLVLYGHWGVNDPRGSGSIDFADRKFEPLGPIHHGRKLPQLQPTRAQLKLFHQQHQELLNFPIIWIDQTKRFEIASAFEDVIQTHGYTCYACAICGNHAHLVIRTHKHKAQRQWSNLAEGIHQRLRHRFGTEIASTHPVISARPYAVLLFEPDEVRRCIRYIEANPVKEHLVPQTWSFVKPYDNWTLHK